MRVPSIIALFSLVFSYGPAAPQQATAGDSASFQIRIVEPQAVPDSAHPPDSAVPAVMQRVDWHPGDSILKITVTFNRVPKRYLAYPMEDKGRIVLDCYETDLAPGFSLGSAPAPLQSASVKEIILKSNITLARLIFYHQSVLAFHIEESPRALELYLRWEKDKPRQEKVSKVKSKRFLYASLGAVAIAGVVTGYLVSHFSSGKGNGGSGEEEIPYIDVPTPDGR